MQTASGAAVKGLRQNKRYITTHDNNGKSIYADSPEQHFNIVPGFGGAARSYSISSIPADLANEKDVQAYKSENGPSSYKAREIVAPQPGANLMICDLSPGGKSYMHRTVSIDYSICVQGELDHELDGGEVVRLYPGDHIVQRGTLHRWSNPSLTEPARFIAVTMPCKPIEISGAGELKESYIPSDEWDKLHGKE